MLSPADRPRLLALDAQLRRLPRPVVDTLWAAVDSLEAAGAEAVEYRVEQHRDKLQARLEQLAPEFPPEFPAAFGTTADTTAAGDAAK